MCRVSGMENCKTADQVCCSKTIMSHLPAFKRDVSLPVLADLCKTFWCHCPQVWSDLSPEFVFLMLAANMRWEVHLTVLAMCASRLQSCSSGPPGRELHLVQCIEAQEKEDVELILMTGPCILASHHPTCERNAGQTYGLSLLGMQEQQEVLLRQMPSTAFESCRWSECILSAWPENSFSSGSSLTWIPSVSRFCCLSFTGFFLPREKLGFAVPERYQWP